MRHRPLYILAPDFTTDSSHMTALVYSLLDAPLWPLMNKFYRHHQSSMKAVKDAQLWVARQEEIIAGPATCGKRLLVDRVVRRARVAQTRCRGDAD